MAMRDLYEVLGVAPDADDSVIKTAYRKMALRWHPDKNQDNLEFAEEQFKEIQNAYEILSDPHERAWYDGHKDAIMRSGERHQAGSSTGFTGGQRPDDEVDLYAYFTSACFSGFGDGPRGFYGVYDELFQRLAKQEQEAHERRADRKGKRPPGPFPCFGFSSAPWEEVSAFYAQWGGFATVKDFSWADQYNPTTAPNRRVRRAMEQENEKARRVVKKEYNEAVRELVGFLKKRDKRVAARQVEEARRREEREREEKARRDQEQAQRAARLREYREAEWVQAASEGSSADEESEDEALNLVWFCAACDKHFKSAPAFDNHQRSKKHLENVELLRAALEEDEAGLASGSDPGEGDDESIVDSASSSGGEEEPLAPRGSAPGRQAEAAAVRGGSTRKNGSHAIGKWQGDSQQEHEAAKSLSTGRGEAASKDASTAAAAAAASRRGYQRVASGAPSADLGSEVDSESGSDDEEGSELDEDSLLERLVATHQGGSRPSSSQVDPAEGAGSAEAAEGRNVSGGEPGTASSDSGSGGDSSSSSSGKAGDASEEVSSSSGEEDGSEGSEGEGSGEDEEDMLQRMLAASRPQSQAKRRQRPRAGGLGGGEAGRVSDAADVVEPAGEVVAAVKGLTEQLGEARLGGGNTPGSGGDEDDWGRGKKGPKQRGKGRGVPHPQQQQQQQQQQARSSTGGAADEAPAAGVKLSAKEKRKQRQAGRGGTEQQQGDGALSCSVCGVDFASRNQLFKHIQSTGHAALKHV